MAVEFKQLFQVRPPANNTPISAYSPGIGVAAIILYIIISNSSGAAATFKIYNDDDGATYDETTQIRWNVDSFPKVPNEIKGKIIMSNPAGNLAVESSVGNALTFTGWGIKKT
jgi:hypothetical protein